MELLRSYLLEISRVLSLIVLAPVKPEVNEVKRKI